MSSNKNMQAHKLSLIAAMLFQQAQSVVASICLDASPMISLEAGVSNLSAIITPPLSRKCEATMLFNDPLYLPIRFSFSPVECDNRQLATFTVPEEAPNGEADIVWQCSGMATSCHHAMIRGGGSNSTMGTERTGLVACILESIQTATALTTRTQSLSTFTETSKTIFTSTSTSFVPETTLLTSDKTTPPYIKTTGDVTGGSTSAKSGQAVVTTQEIDNRTPGQAADTTTDASTITGTTTGTTTGTVTGTISNTRDTGHTTRTTADHEILEPTTPAPIQPTATATANTNDKQHAPPATPSISNDGAFAGSATRVMPPAIATSVTTTLITTMTVTGTVAAICGSTTKQV